MAMWHCATLEIISVSWRAVGSTLSAYCLLEYSNTVSSCSVTSHVNAERVLTTSQIHLSPLFRFVAACSREELTVGDPLMWHDLLAKLDSVALP